MKEKKNPKTAEEMIDREVEKINSGKVNESNLLRLVFLNGIKNQLEDSWLKMLSSRDKEEAQFAWRAVSNEIDWLNTILLLGKSVEMSNDICKMFELKQQYSFETIQTLQTERDLIKADTYRGFEEYDRIVEEQEKYRKDGVYDSRIDMKAKEILSIVKSYDEERRNDFWLKYFTMADKLIYTSQIKEEKINQKGE